MKTRSIIALLIIGFAAFIIGTALIVRPTSQERDFSDAYKGLKLGMTESEVERIFGVPPHFKGNFQGAPIHYYEPPPPRTRWLDTRGEIDTARFNDGDAIVALDEIPDPYDHVVVAYDRHGILIAYTRIGEELHVHTKARGLVDGASFQRLRPSDFGGAEASAGQGAAPKR